MPKRWPRRRTCCPAERRIPHRPADWSDRSAPLPASGCGNGWNPPFGGKLIFLVRAKDDGSRPRSTRQGIRRGDSRIAFRHYRKLVAGHLEVIAGDKGRGKPRAGSAAMEAAGRHRRPVVDPPPHLSTRAFRTLAVSVRRHGYCRADPARSHGQTEPFTYVSTIGVATDLSRRTFTKTPTSRVMSPTRGCHPRQAMPTVPETKWAGEVLLVRRMTYSPTGLRLPRDIIMADTTYAGQLIFRTCSPGYAEPGSPLESRLTRSTNSMPNSNLQRGRISTDCPWVSSPTRLNPRRAGVTGYRPTTL